MNGRSKLLFEKARQLIPGGVNSPVRAGKAVGVDPPFIADAEGCMLRDVDGKSYIDYVCSWGPMILGHADPRVTAAIEESARRGTSYGAPTEVEVDMAEIIVEMVPSIDMVRMVNSGTEATMSAVRLARGYTGRDKIIKFDGLLPRPCGQPAGGGGFGNRNPGNTGKPGCPGIPRGKHPFAPF